MRLSDVEVKCGGDRSFSAAMLRSRLEQAQKTA
jgi:hypothetical protein